MMNNKNNSGDQAQMIAQAINSLTEKLGELTGHEILIGWGMYDGEETLVGAVSTGGMEYGVAGKLYLGIGGYIDSCFGENGELLCRDCE